MASHPLWTWREPETETELEPEPEQEPEMEFRSRIAIRLRWARPVRVAPCDGTRLSTRHDTGRHGMVLGQ